MRSIGVLIVGQSAVVREQIGDAIRLQSGMHVVGTASDGRRGLELVEQQCPDVVALDVQMPGLDGLQTLDALLLARAVPVVMLCAASPIEAEMTLAALERGAQDYLLKPESGSLPEPTFAGDVVRKVRAAAGLDVPRILPHRRSRTTQQKIRSGKSGSLSKPASFTVSSPAGHGDA